jgi:phosphoribosylaminoimidazolecarboxamide formyltransferase/IMP cyclohydrolase
MRALLSVWDKRGLVGFAEGLAALDVELVASGGTAAALDEAGIAHRKVEDLTGWPEMLAGRVKTLHPALHAGILADLDDEAHRADLRAHDITPIDLVVCNLYPFSSDPSIKLIDVGGPTMVRAAAKNHAHVGVVVDPSDYDAVLTELRESGALGAATRVRLARTAFAHTAAYDAAIVEWFDTDVVPPDGLPASFHLTLELAQSLRYGENPHQRGARYRIQGHASFWDQVVQHAGSALSYLNLFDADAAWRLAYELAGDTGRVAAVIVKHANACGAAVADDVAEAYRLALGADELSAFGGVVAVTGAIDATVASAIAGGPQADVVIAASLTDEGRDLLVARRKATRLLSAPAPAPPTWSIRTIGDAVLLQDADRFECVPASWEVVTSRAPSAAELVDLGVAWRVCARTSSNAIVLARDGVAVGIGAGQQSRVVPAQLAAAKAGDRSKGAAAASDAFFPFPDGLEALAAAGVTAVVQPGGSIRDADVIAAADEAGIAMVFTSERHFRH